ncbi:MAG: DsrE family protein [Gammaproteobacteria bacterium]|nr:DsrE family protein [Gammaproteobacteria bacterium]
MSKFGAFCVLISFTLACWSEEKARYVEPAYELPKVVYEFYLDDPAKMSAALYWVRALINPLTESPYDMAPDFMDIKLVIHGSEIVTLVKKNYPLYRDVVERMRYYAALGVEFKVCKLAAEDYHYDLDDFYEFIELVPSAFTELVHWQQQGYALIIPQVFLRTRSLEEIR